MAVDVSGVGDVENQDQAALLIDSVHDLVGASPSTVTTCEGPEQRLADPTRVLGQRPCAELQDRRGNCLREPLSQRAPSGAHQLDPVCGRRHPPDERRSWWG